jgi:hypothetical protein
MAKFKTTFYKIFFAATTTLLLLSLLVEAGQATERVAFIDAEQRIVDEILIDESENCALVTVKFNFPAQYVRHFPTKSGEELHIKLSLLTAKPTNKNALLARESITPPPNDIAALSNVSYEGNRIGGPFLILYFTDTVAFKVEQGSDFRSLNITVNRSESSAPCLPPPNKSEMPSHPPTDKLIK